MRPFVATTAAIAFALLFSAQVSAQKRTLPDLPNQTVNDFMQDSEGLVWISTNYGICRFNGTEYTNYYHVPSDSTSIPSNRVLCSEEDSDGLIWILTDKALSVHRKGEDSFSTVSHNYGFNGLIRTDLGITAYGNDGFQQLSKNPQVKDAVNEATEDTIAWAEVSPHSGQILAVSADTHKLELYSSSLELRHVFESDTTGFVTCACEDSYSRIWVGTTNGVKVYDHSDGYWKEAVEFKKYLGFLDHTEIKVLLGGSNYIYICTNGEDIHVFNCSRFTIEKGISKRRILDLNYTSDFSCALQTSDETVWIGTRDRGYATHNAKNIDFSPNRRTRTATNGKYLNSISTSNGVVWIASRYKGILATKDDLSDIRWTNYIDATSPDRTLPPEIGTIVCYGQNNMLISSSCGLYDARIKGLHLHSIISTGINIGANAMCSTPDGAVAIGSPKGMLLYRDKIIEKCILEGKDITDVFCCADSSLLASCSGEGIFKVDKDWSRTELVAPLKGQAESISDAHSVRVAPDGAIWVATVTDGVFIIRDDQIQHIGIKDGLLSDEVVSIEFDADGNAWLGTMQGLSLVRNGSTNATTYTTLCPIKEYLPRCSAYTGKAMFFSGPNGLTYFHPKKNIDKISDEPVKLKIQNTIPAGKKGIILPHNQNSITIRYESICFQNPEALQFSYRLCGYNDEWINVGQTRFASWSRLPAGRYRFELTACNPNGFWNKEPVCLPFRVKPSPFLAWYAYLFYIVLLILAVYIYMRISVERRVHQKELAMTREALEKEKKMSAMKIDFFNNISHELRTSLSLVYGPISMLSKADEKKRDSLVSIARTNTRELLNLIDQMLNLSRIENECLPLSVCLTDINSQLSRCVEAFSEAANEKGLSLDIDSIIPNDCLLPIDTDKFWKIMQNLLSNAIKYSNSGGYIVAKAELEGAPDSRWLKVSVIDEGPGMTEEEARTIFDRYKRLRSNEKSASGTGIGLHYVRELVKVHKGTIQAIIRKDTHGMIFSFCIPAEMSSYNCNEIQESDTALIEGMNSINVPEASNTLDSKPVIAIVEDDRRMQDYLMSILQDDYRVVCASNAQEGLELIASQMPSIVTSDVMMEGMNGFELCKRVKEDPLLSHIPVILLTAKVSDEDKISGFKSKANAYITKPFNPELLMTVIKNLLSERDAIREALLHPSEKTVDEASKMSDFDRKFIERVNVFIESRLSESTPSISELGEATASSRSSLFRKMKALTGVSPNEYILIYKLNKSKEMLKEADMNISEISYALGFSSPSHFSRSFKEHFGCSPRDYSSR